MKTLLLAGLAGATAITPAAASSTESPPAANSSNGVVYTDSTNNNVTSPDRHRANYDDRILMNDDRVFASHSGMRGSSIYQGDWNGAYREDGTYQGLWQGTYRDAQGTVYEGQYVGTFIGNTNPSQTGVSYDEPPLFSSAEPVDAGSDYQVQPQYSRVPSPEYRAPVPQPQYQEEVRYPSGWNGGYYYPAYYYPPVTTIVIQSAPTTTTTTYYEE